MIDDGYLFEFHAEGVAYRYTNLDEPVTRLGHEYEPILVEVPGEIKIGSSPDNGEWQIDISENASVSKLWLDEVPNFIVTVTVFRYDREDQDWFLEWSGTVITPVWKENLIELKCEDEYTSLRTFGMRYVIQKECQHDLYGDGCQLERNGFVVNDTATQINGEIITIAAAHPDGFFDGGYIAWTDAATGVDKERTIDFQIGNALTMDVLVNNLAPNTSVRIYPGCDHTLQACFDKFDDNTLNYSGYPWMPDQNPSTDEIF